MLVVWKIFVNVRRHLSGLHTNFAKITLFPHKMCFYRVKLISNIRMLYVKDVFKILLQFILIYFVDEYKYLHIKLA